MTKKDTEIMDSMIKTYGDAEKAKRVFYASANAGKLGKDVKRRHGSKARSKRGK